MVCSLLRAVAVYPKPHLALMQALDYLLFGHLSAAHATADPPQRREKAAYWQHLFSQLIDKNSLGTLNLEVRIPPSKHQLKIRLAELRAMGKTEALGGPIFANILLGGKLGLLDFRLP
jgi:hypothetical protein